MFRIWKHHARILNCSAQSEYVVLKERMSILDFEIYLLDIPAAASNDSSEFVIKLQMYFKMYLWRPAMKRLFHEHAQGC